MINNDIQSFFSINKNRETPGQEPFGRVVPIVWPQTLPEARQVVETAGTHLAHQLERQAQRFATICVGVSLMSRRLFVFLSPITFAVAASLPAVNTVAWEFL